MTLLAHLSQNSLVISFISFGYTSIAFQISIIAELRCWRVGELTYGVGMLFAIDK